MPGPGNFRKARINYGIPAINRIRISQTSKSTNSSMPPRGTGPLKTRINGMQKSTQQFIMGEILEENWKNATGEAPEKKYPPNSNNGK